MLGLALSFRPPTAIPDGIHLAHVASLRVRLRLELSARACNSVSLAPRVELHRPVRVPGRRNSMSKLNRRSALALGLGAVAAAVVKPAASQTMDMTAGKDTTLAPGVVQRAYGETPAIIPGCKSVSLRDIIIQPGSKTGENPMKNAMVCHI